MLHALALRMGRTVAELRATLTEREWLDWMAYAKGSPFADDRMDYLFANLCQVVCMAMGAKKASGGNFTLDDFILFKPKDYTTPIEFMRAQLGHRVVKGKRRKKE